MTKIGYVRLTQDPPHDEGAVDIDADQGDVDDRAMWRACVDQLRLGDTLIVDSLDRLPEPLDEDRSVQEQLWR